jgi:adenosine deaminase
MIDPTLPFIDLHRHLDGSVRLETILDLGEEHNLPLPARDIESLRPYVQVTKPQVSVMAFISKFEWMTGVLVDLAACKRVAYESVEDAYKEGLDYVELRFSPWFMAEAHQLDPNGVVEAVIDGIDQGLRDFNIKVNLIGILSRTYGIEIAAKELGALMSQSERFVALDLAGDEFNFPAELFRDHFRKAQDSGWQVTVHAGEIAGSESIWSAINDLGAQRIGHALSAVNDPDLLKFMAEKEIGIEANLTSNLQTSSIPSYAAHPINQFLYRGVLATINTDDPGISNIDLAHEFTKAAPEAGLTDKQIQQAQRNALSIAFLSKDEKQKLLAKKQANASHSM